jgi:hypothetical protein
MKTCGKPQIMISFKIFEASHSQEKGINYARVSRSQDKEVYHFKENHARDKGAMERD